MTGIFDGDHDRLSEYLTGYAQAIEDAERRLDGDVDVLVEIIRALYPRRDWRREVLEHQVLRLTNFRRRPAPGRTAGTDPADRQGEHQ